MFGIARTILGWCDKKCEESFEEDNLKKAALSGFVEGLIDGAIIMYVPLVIGCMIKNKKLSEK